MISFRLWIEQLYYDNCEEHRIYNESVLTRQEYFTQFKWWLRREYRHKQRTGQL